MHIRVLLSWALVPFILLSGEIGAQAMEGQRTQNKSELTANAVRLPSSTELEVQGRSAPAIERRFARPERTALTTTSSGKMEPQDSETELVTSDEFSWLERNDPRVAEWVQAQNRHTLDTLHSDPRFAFFYNSALSAESMEGRRRGPGNISTSSVRVFGEWLYQHWQDGEHPRGVWRRTRLDDYLAARPEWETLLDVDALARNEGRAWVFVGGWLSPNRSRALIQLSDAGALKFVWREFDIAKKEFVKDGLSLPEQYGTHAVWRSDDSLLVTANFGRGTVTATQDPISVRVLRRGQLFHEATEIFRGDPSDHAVVVNENEAAGTQSTVPGERRLTFLQLNGSGQTIWWEVQPNGRVAQLTMPAFCHVSLFQDQYIIRTTRDWSVNGRIWKAGSLLAVPVAHATERSPPVHLIMEPPEDTVLEWWDRAREGIVIYGRTLGNGRMWVARYKSGQWSVQPVPMPGGGSIFRAAADSASNVVLFTYQSYLQPLTLYLLDMSVGKPVAVAQNPPEFDAEGLIAEEFEAKSSDGTSVPYFVVRPEKLSGRADAPTLVEGYGALGGTVSPMYQPVLGKLWLERSGVYVFANVRGSTARGESWWVKGAQRQLTYDDMFAVIEDLIRRRITSPKRIGIVGYSAGGLLAGVLLTQRPELFGAAVLKAAPLDLFRKDLMGGSHENWEREYGSEKIPAERAFLKRTSPFQNVRPDSGAPAPLIVTGSTDDRILPAGPRRFAAKLQALGMPFYFYESPEGGHSLASTPEGHALIEALTFTYLNRMLMDDHNHVAGN